MKITLLGTGNPAPSLKRMGSGYIVEIADDVIVFDHGPGSHHRLLQTGKRATDVTHAFFSHLHYDHFVDFPRLLLTRWDSGAAQIPELRIFGPKPIKRLVDGLIGPEGVFGPDLTARTNWDSSLHVYRARGGKEPRLPPAPEVREIASADVIETDHWRIQVAEVPHAQPWLTCLAYRVDTDAGSLVYSGDTGPSPALEKLAKDCDLLIHMCSYITGSVDNRATQLGTSGHLETARAAAAAGARRLVATHIYDQFDLPGVRERVIAEMSRVYDGVIVIGEDLMELSLNPDAGRISMTGSARKSDGVSLERNVECVARDGTILRADVYHPADGGKYPTLLNRTPYGKLEPRYVDDAHTLVRRGYTVVIQDQRGRYASDGEFRWMFRDRLETFDVEDGFDAAQWASQLPWSNGQLGTWGHSNASWAAWMLASSQPPALKAIMASGMCQNLLTMNFGIFETGRRLEWIYLMAADARRRAGEPFGPYTAAEATERWNTVERGKYIWWLPLGDIPASVFSTLDEPLQVFHRAQNKEFTRFGELHEKITAPMMLMTGWWDRLIGTIDNYVGLVTNGPPHLRDQHRLIVGPWVHDVTQFTRHCGPFDFGPDAEWPYADMISRWYDFQLKGVDNGLAGEAPVQLFILGENIWRGEREWPLARTRYTEFFLHSGGHANTVHGDGSLSLAPPADSERPDEYDYDPRDPVMSLMRGDAQAAPVDQSPHDHRRDVLMYQTPPLTEDIEVTGPIVLKLWAASSCPDTDWTAKLAVVLADGLCVNLTYGIMRAKYRNGFDSPALIEPGKPTLYEIKLNPTGILFKAGQRIRLYVSSSDFPNFDRNHNTGRDYWSDPELRVAHQTIFHAGDQRSCLILPVIPR